MSLMNDPKEDEPMSRRVAGLVLLLVLAAVAARFAKLEVSPPGFFRDEASAAVNIICLSQDGTSAGGRPHPLFFPSYEPEPFGGFYTAPYIYFGAAWVKVFGYSISSIRAISALFVSLTILGAAMLGYYFGGPSAALFTALTASLSPWGFQFSRIAWDPPLMPCFFIWGLYFFLTAVDDPGPLRWLRDLIAGVLFSLAMYAYAAARLQVPLVVLALIAVLVYKKRISGRRLAVLGLAWAVPSTPLVIGTLNGTLQGRLSMLSIFSPAFLASQPGRSVGAIWLKNAALHFAPRFLFLSGDVNLRHSTQFVGELSWLDDFALASGLLLLIMSYAGKDARPPKERPLKTLLSFTAVFAGIFAGILPASLTWDSVPHALRAIGTWPFVSLLAGFCLRRAYRRDRRLAVPTILIAAAFAFSFGSYYFGAYPAAAAAWFDAPVKAAAEESARSGDWSAFGRAVGGYADVSARYYLMRYGGETCGSSRETIWALKHGRPPL
jgi:hypothetical protein